MGVVCENGYESSSAGGAVNVADSLASTTINEEQLTVGTSVVVLTPAKYVGAVKAVITVEGGAIRVKTGTINPTASIGLLINDGDVIELTGSELANFKAISVSSTVVTLNIEYKG